MFSSTSVRRFYSLTNAYKYISRNIFLNLKNYPAQNFITENLNINNLRFLSTSRINYSITVNNETISEAFVNLDSNFKNEQRIYKDDIEQLTRNIECEDSINVDNITLLLQCCGHLIPDELPCIRIALAQKVWETVKTKNLSLNVDHYNALLQCYIENNMVLSYKEFLSNMTCQPNEQTYDLLLESVCCNGDMSQAVEIVNIMKEKDMSLNEPVFNSLIMGHLHSGDVKNAQNILDTMRIAQMKPSSNTYTVLMKGYARISDTNLFRNTLNLVASREFNIKQFISIIRSVCLAEKTELLSLIKKTWPSKFETRIFETNLSRLCINLVYMRKPLIAYELFKTFVEPEIGFVTESDTYCSFLLYELIRSKTPSAIIIKIADDLIRSNRNSFALTKAIEIALKMPDANLSLELFKAMFDRKIQLRTHYFWPILIQEAKLSGEQGIFKIFEIMTNYKVPIDNDTLEMYSLQYIKNMDPDMSILITKLKQFNLTVTDIITPICITLLRRHKIKQTSDIILKYKVKIEGNKLIKSLTSAFIETNDIQNTIKILKTIDLDNQSNDLAGQLISYIFIRSGKNVHYQQVINILKAYKSKNIKISSQYMDKIEHFTKKINDSKMKIIIQNLLKSLDCKNGIENNEHIPHPRNMNLDELECHLVELRNKNMETRGILRKLIQMHCRIGNIDRVNVLYREFEELGYEVSPGMKSSLLDAYNKAENLDSAWKIYRDVKENFIDFHLDEFKIIDLACLLIASDRFEDAVNILKTEASNRKIRGGSTIERNCWKLLDTIARTGNVSKTRQIFKILISNGYCTETNIILGPLVRVHICNDDLKNAVEEYRNCSENFGKTPLAHELLCYLVEKENDTELIKLVVEATTSVHGIANSQISLVAALAETGQIKTLRKYFIEFNSNLSSFLLEQFCQRWIVEGKIHALENIINSTQGINIDLSAIYLNLMRVYSSNNDCDSALSLWNNMQERDILPSEEIKNIITNLLESEKHPKANNL